MTTSVVVPAVLLVCLKVGLCHGAICCNVPIIIIVKASDVREIACHMASFLALETFIIITGHGVDQ